MGSVTGVRMSMHRRTGSMQMEPTRRACLLHVACGMISPKTTMMPVASRPPITPDVMSPIRIASRAFTRVFDRRSVQSSWLPFFRSGRIFSARDLSGSLPPAMMISSPVVSSDISPSVSPLKRAERQMSTTGDRIIVAVISRGAEHSTTHEARVSSAHAASHIPGRPRGWAPARYYQ